MTKLLINILKHATKNTNLYILEQLSWLDNHYQFRSKLVEKNEIYNDALR